MLSGFWGTAVSSDWLLLGAPTPRLPSAVFLFWFHTSDSASVQPI